MPYLILCLISALLAGGGCSKVMLDEEVMVGWLGEVSKKPALAGCGVG